LGVGGLGVGVGERVHAFKHGVSQSVDHIEMLIWYVEPCILFTYRFIYCS
jgi:hypothetical protein